MLDVPHQYIIHSFEHQQVVCRLLRKISNLFEAERVYYRWETLTAIKIDESATSAVPDLSLTYDGETKVIIEITLFESVDYQKLAKLVNQYDLDEGFTYNYKTKQWRKYKFQLGEVLESPSFCDSIGYDLNEFLK